MPSLTIDPAPFWLEGNDTGILLVHGFTGSPLDLKTFGQALNDKGYTVCAPLLPGHGTTPEAMANTNRCHWYRSAETALLSLQKQTRRVFVVGHSMGGLITLNLTRFYPVAGVVTICTPVFLRNWLIYTTPLLKFIKPSVGKGTDKDLWPLLEPRFTYEQVPTVCLAELVALIQDTKRLLDKVQVPIVVLQGQADLTVKSASVQYIYDHVASEHKELHYIPGGGHQILLQQQRGQVLDIVLEFISKYDKGESKT